MKLSVIERISLLQILPGESSFSTFKILLSLKSALSFNEKEYKEFGMREEDGKIFWSSSKEKDIDIGEKASDIIVEALKKLDKAGKINEQSYNLYIKFIGEKQS